MFLSVVFVGKIKLLSLGGVILEWEDTLENPNSERYNQVTGEVESAVSIVSLSVLCFCILGLYQFIHTYRFLWASYLVKLVSYNSLKK